MPPLPDQIQQRPGHPHFVGEWLTELAFGEFKGDEGTVLHANLRYLCHVVPELWVSCGKADAALMAFRPFSAQRRS